MALKLSTGLRNKMLSGTSCSFREIFTGGVFTIYTGSAPTSPDSAPSGSLVCTFGAATFGTTGTAGTVALAASAVSGTCSIAGTVGYFRLSESGDGSTASTTGARLQGVVGKTDAAGADLTLVNTIVLANQVLTITTGSVGFP